jgi:nitrogenase molybdenum-iron protein alpha/beta subunit
METPGFSRDICTGYETAALELLRQLPLQAPLRGSDAATTEPSVNILGLSLYHKNFAGDSAELTRLLTLCGITVNCFLCADCDLGSIGEVPRAALNIVLHPEYGLGTAQYLQAAYGTPFYVGDGLPLGFAATEKMICEVCGLLGNDPANFLAESEKARARAYSYISRVNSLTGLPKGVTFALEGTYAEIYAYASFLTRYFGMVLECASVLNEHSDCCRDQLLTLLDELDLRAALARDIGQTTSELVFASGNTIARLKLGRHVFVGVEISLPTIGFIDVVPKTHLGIQGALTLTEQVINGLLF